MEKLKNAARWLRKYWYIPLTLIVGLLGTLAGVFLQRRFNSPLDTVRDEVKAIDSVAETAKLIQMEGVIAASRQLEIQHEDTIDAADERAYDKVVRLRDNPSALSKHLVRTGEKLRRARRNGDSSW